MKIVLNKNRFNVNPDFFLRRAGYGQISSFYTGKTSYVRRFTREHYPRFHMYFEVAVDKITFNLHLDQKETSYKGADHAHNADHDGPAVEGEIDRLKGLLRTMSATGASGQTLSEGREDWEKQLSEDLKKDGSRAPQSGNFRNDQPVEKKKGFFGKMFGF